MSQPIRGWGGHLVFQIGPKNTNLVEDVEILHNVKFRWIPFSGFREEVENVKVYGRTNDGRCAMTIAHLSLRLRWAKNRWQPWLLIGRDIFDFSSETASQNSTKLDRKEDLNVLYQLCIFSGRSEKQYGCPGLWLADTFSTSPLKPQNGIQRNLSGSKKHDLNVLYLVYVFQADE